MPQIKIITHINVPSKKVIDFVADPENHQQFFPTLKSIQNIKRVSGIVGTTWDWVFINLGEEVVGTAKVDMYVEEEVFSFRAKGNYAGYEGGYKFVAKQENGGCELELDVDYQTPEALKGKILSKGRVIEVDENDIHRLTEAEATITMRILRSVLEDEGKKV